MVWLNGQSCTVAASLFRFTHTASLVKVVVCLLPLDFRGGGGGRRISQSDRSKSLRNRHSAVLLLRHIDGSVVEWDAQTEKGVFWLVKKKIFLSAPLSPLAMHRGVVGLRAILSIFLNWGVTRERGSAWAVWVWLGALCGIGAYSEPCTITPCLAARLTSFLLFSTKGN